ncbi:alpha/beta-hydrolase [Aulographum hederae CBS 113979]|uniref:Alpha/beta-hydrolase n=1 Tax=Aulographum hederae CBS 113979 TaxID=1176131 RepID=A0A6G1GQ85_9PEZI|nr:alpha/beta-hydrolase [Aulographum hederae CBS 113979]
MHFSIFSGVFLVNLHVTLALPIRGDSHRWINPEITWSKCADSNATNLHCGKISVPLDYNRPWSEIIEIGMTRLSSTSPSRRGILVYNPGGPGVVASDYIVRAAEGESDIFSPRLMEAYDIVGPDPRGVGLSHPVQCDPDIFNQRVSLFPSTREEYESLISHNARLGQSCAELTGSLFNNLDTINVVKDLDLIRQALYPMTNLKLNLLGRSYGSQIGLQYAELFPKNIDRFALDGVVDHTESATSTVYSESRTYEATLELFFSWCNTTSDCALHGRDTAAIVEKMIQSAQKTPIPAPFCEATGDYACRSDVTAEELLQNIQNYLLFQNATSDYTGWDFLSQALANASNGDASTLSTPLATSTTSWQYPGLAIGCQDWLHPAQSLQDLQYLYHLTAVTAPLTLGVSQSYYYQTACLGWPAPLTNPQKSLSPNVKNAPPMLLVNAQFDPSTSIVWATVTQEAVPQSVLLTRVGAGHTSYQLLGEASFAIDRYLMDGILPEKATFVYS